MNNPSQKLISIIVPIYNLADRLEPCLQSILAQDYPDFELLLINDGSTDASLQICRDYAGQDSRIRVLDKPNGGVSTARNLGLDTCAGDYITFVDGDDYIEPNYCSTLLHALEQNHADICSCNAYQHNVSTDSTYMLKEDDEIVSMKASDYDYTRPDKNHMAVWCVMFRREAIHNVRFAEDIFIAEDSLFFAQAVRNAEKIIHLHKNLYHYMQYEVSSSHDRYTPKKLTSLESWRRICELNRNCPKALQSCRANYANRCLRILRWYFFRFGIEPELYRKTLAEYRSCLPDVRACYHGRKGLASRIELMAYYVYAAVPASYPVYYLLRYRKKD